MAYYQLSKVLKMRRTVLGYSQEDFDVEGPTGMTVYRIEKGKNTTTKHTYHNLTNAMGIKENTRQGILKTNDITLLLLTNEVSDLISQGAFHNAQDILEEIEKRLDNTVLRNQQYINYIKNKLLYLQKELQDIDYEHKLKECITYGPKNFKELGMKQWPFHEREWQRLFALEKVLRQQKKYEQQRNLLEEMKKLLESGYMESEYSMIYLIFTRQQLGDVLGNLGFHRKAICFDKETLNLCQERQELRFQAELYYDIFWNYKMIREKETLTKKEENDCRQCLIHAYYINEALSTGKEIYKRALEKYYGITM